MDLITYIIIIAGVLFVGVLLAYLILMKKMGKSEYRQMKKLQEGTKAESFSMDILYQKLYIRYIKTPFIKRYIFKLRRRLEIINLDDEYITRMESAKIITKAILIFVLVALLTILITKNNLLLMTILKLRKYLIL